MRLLSSTTWLRRPLPVLFGRVSFACKNDDLPLDASLFVAVGRIREM